VKNQGRIEKEKTLKQAGEIAGLPSELQLRGFQFPLSPEHRLNTPNAPDEEKAREKDEGIIQRHRGDRQSIERVASKKKRGTKEDQEDDTRAYKGT
jgi:hypothetical protein